MAKKVGVCLVAVLWLGAAMADEVSNIKSEVEDLKAKISAMEAAQMAPAAGGDAESLTSMKKKGSIKIGGNVCIQMIVARRDDRGSYDDKDGDGQQNELASKHDTVDSTSFNTEDADIDFQVNASKDVWMFIKIDADECWRRDGGNMQQDDILEECYFVWNAINGTPFGVKFGKMEAPFGQDIDPLLINAVTSNGTTSALGTPWEAADSTGANSNPHRAVGDYTKPGEIDNVFCIAPYYKFKNMAKLEVAVFQSNTTRGNGAMTRGMHEDRSDDTLFFQSFCGRLTITPRENLSIVISGLNEHVDSYGDADLAAGRITANTVAAAWGAEAGEGQDATEDRQAISLAFDYKCKKLPLEIWTEWLHGWDYAFNERYDADVLAIGGKYGLTDKIDLYLIGDWIGIDDDRVRNYQQDEDYYRILAAVQYKMDCGITLTAEYAHEWYDLDWDDTGARERVDSAEADVFLIGTKFAF